MSCLQYSGPESVPLRPRYHLVILDGIMKFCSKNGPQNPWHSEDGTAALCCHTDLIPTRRLGDSRDSEWSLAPPSVCHLESRHCRRSELNPQENIWQFMRARGGSGRSEMFLGALRNWLSNRIFKSFDEIVDHCCYAWNTLIDQRWKIMSIARRDWAVASHSL
jgi:hypothetical protein